MSIVKAIYNVKPEYYSYSADGGYQTVATIRYNGRTYIGYSFVHPDDEDFASTRVGKNIALSRARTKAMENELRKEQSGYVYKKQLYNEIFLDVKSDYSERANNLLIQTERRCKNLRVAIKKEKHNLNKYLQGQAKAIESIRRFRSKQDITS